MNRDDLWTLILAGLTMKRTPLRRARPQRCKDMDLLNGWLKRVVETDAGCWEWQGATFAHGYGAICYQGSSTAAHRVIYRVLVSELPRNLDLDHLCRNRICVNPDHLEPVSRRENLMRGAHPRQGRLGRVS